MKKSFFIVFALLLISIVVNVWQCSRQPEPSVVVKRDTMWRDSMIYLPQSEETANTGKVVYIKVPVPNGDTQGTGTTVPSDDGTGESQSPCVTNDSDSISVPIPIYQKRYDDSLYTAWVSGYEPNLDSINLRLPTITETITKTIIKPSPLITFGIQAGAGYGIINRQPDILVGIGCQINLWKK